MQENKPLWYSSVTGNFGHLLILITFYAISSLFQITIWQKSGIENLAVVNIPSAATAA